MKLTWLGQSGFLLESVAGTLVCDPYLSNSCLKLNSRLDHTRRTPLGMLPEELRGIDAYLITHAHADHLDRETAAPLARVSPETVFIAPPSCGDLGVPHQLSARAGEALSVGPWRIVPVPACHETLARDGNGDFISVSYMVLLSQEKTAVFFAGDTIPYAGQAEEVRSARPNGFRLIMALPVNGRDEARHAIGLAGNLNYAEALDLARESGAETVLPCHYGMFAGNDPADAPDLAEWAHAEIEFRALAPFRAAEF